MLFPTLGPSSLPVVVAQPDCVGIVRQTQSKVYNFWFKWRTTTTLCYKWFHDNKIIRHAQKRHVFIPISKVRKTERISRNPFVKKFEIISELNAKESPEN